MVRQFQFDPAQQTVGFIGDDVARQVAVAAKYREQIARGIAVGALQQLRAVTHRRLIEHGRPGVGQRLVIGAQKPHGAHVLLVKGLAGDTLQQGRIVPTHGGCNQWRELLGDHFTALQQLRFQF